MKKQERVMIIDALNLFVRSYIVNPSLAKDGTPIGGVVGFLKSLQKLTRDINPTQVVVCWDGRGGSRKRKQQNSNYKEGRSPIRLNRNFKILTEQEEKENKITQMYKIMDYLNSLPVIQLVADEVEADDIISYVCRYSYFKDCQKVIVSSDKDFYQLLDDTTVLHRPIQKRYLNRKDIIEEHGIHPNNFALARAVVGDKSDNLVGVSGVGLKTVAKRFPFFKKEDDVTINELIEYCENQESKIQAYKAIPENKQLIIGNYKLMQLYSPSMSIQTKQSIDWSVKQFEYNFNKTELSILMHQDGIDKVDWSDMIQKFRKISIDNKKRYNAK